VIAHEFGASAALGDGVREGAEQLRAAQARALGEGECEANARLRHRLAELLRGHQRVRRDPEPFRLNPFYKVLITQLTV